MTQYECGHPNLPPNCCTQYFYGMGSGTVQTFNFDGGIHLADQVWDNFMNVILPGIYGLLETSYKANILKNSVWSSIRFQNMIILWIVSEPFNLHKERKRPVQDLLHNSGTRGFLSFGY